MGFGFNLFFVFILVPVTVILIVISLVTGKKTYGKWLGYTWLGVVGLVVLSLVIHALTDKKDLKKDDYYGSYIINREYFPGKQSNWQYNHFRFEIRENDSIFFYVTNKDKVLKTYRGSITTTPAYISERLIVNMEQPTHHVLTSNPTTYRGAWSFYLVFNSPKYNNMYFKKGKWKPIKD